MNEVRVAVLGASGWMGKVHTMAYQTFPHFLGRERGEARIVSLVEANPQAAAGLENRAPGARILNDWKEAVNDPEVDLIDSKLEPRPTADAPSASGVLAIRSSHIDREGTKIMTFGALKQLTRTLDLRLGHYVGEFVTPGIGYMLKEAGCEYCFLDTEHSGMGFDVLNRTLRFMEAASMPTMVRVPSSASPMVSAGIWRW